MNWIGAFFPSFKLWNKKAPPSAEEGERVEAANREPDRRSFNEGLDWGWCWSRKSICWPTPPQRFAPR